MTALRWWGLLKKLGYQVRVSSCQVDETCDLLVALHAIKSGPVLARFKGTSPGKPAVVVLTGTDIFQTGENQEILDQSMHLADRIVVLQKHMVSLVPDQYRQKVRVIYQSFAPKVGMARAETDLRYFEVLVLGHLRDVKDPLLAARASRMLPAASRIRVTQVGGILEEKYREQVRQECAENPRYRWQGELSRSDALEVLAHSQVLVQSSLAEGGPSSVSEAIALGVAVISTTTSGVVGLLGADHPGLIPFNDPKSLAEVLRRCEMDVQFLKQIRERGEQSRPLIDPAREISSLRSLVLELSAEDSVGETGSG